MSTHNIWAATGQNQQNGCVPSKDSDQPGHPPTLIRVFAVRMKKPWVISYPLSTQRRLIRLGRCPGWSDSSLGTHLFCWFCHVVAHMFLWRTKQNYLLIITKYPPYLFHCDGQFDREKCCDAFVYRTHQLTQLTLSCLVSHLWDKGKQCRPRSLHSAVSDQGLQCLHSLISIKNIIKMKKVNQTPLKWRTDSSNY